MTDVDRSKTHGAIGKQSLPIDRGAAGRRTASSEASRRCRRSWGRDAASLPASLESALSSAAPRRSRLNKSLAARPRASGVATRAVTRTPQAAAPVRHGPRRGPRRASSSAGLCGRASSSERGACSSYVRPGPALARARTATRLPPRSSSRGPPTRARRPPARVTRPVAPFDERGRQRSRPWRRGGPAWPARGDARRRPWRAWMRGSSAQHNALTPASAGTPAVLARLERDAPRHGSCATDTLAREQPPEARHGLAPPARGLARHGGLGRVPAADHRGVTPRGLQRGLAADEFFLHIGGIDQHRRQQRRRVLFVGNGIALTGRAFAPTTSTSP